MKVAAEQVAPHELALQDDIDGETHVFERSVPR